jgi:hypothetical protein
MVIMFYQVKVLDRYGNLKKVVSEAELRNTHWNRFDENKKKYEIPKKKPFVAIENNEPLHMSQLSNNRQV